MATWAFTTTFECLWNWKVLSSQKRKTTDQLQTLWSRIMYSLPKQKVGHWTDKTFVHNQPITDLVWGLLHEINHITDTVWVTRNQDWINQSPRVKITYYSSKKQKVIQWYLMTTFYTQISALINNRQKSFIMKLMQIQRFTDRHYSERERRKSNTKLQIGCLYQMSPSLGNLQQEAESVRSEGIDNTKFF